MTFIYSDTEWYWEPSRHEMVQKWHWTIWGGASSTHRGLSEEWLNRSAPSRSSARVKVWSRCSVLSPPSCSRTSRPLVGGCSSCSSRFFAGLSRSSARSSQASSRRTPPAGTSREPFTCSTGAWVLAAGGRREQGAGWEDQWCRVMQIEIERWKLDRVTSCGILYHSEWNREWDQPMEGEKVRVRVRVSAR